MSKLTLLAVTLSLAAAVPSHARDARETARVVKALGMQSGNAKVVEALQTLEAEGFITNMSEALSDSEAAASDSAVPTPGESPGPAAPSEAPIDTERVAQIAFTAAKPLMEKALGGTVSIGQKWVTKSSYHGKPAYKVQIMPQSMTIVVFFVTYTAYVDAASMQVIPGSVK